MMSLPRRCLIALMVVGIIGCQPQREQEMIDAAMNQRPPLAKIDGPQLATLLERYEGEAILVFFWSQESRKSHQRLPEVVATQKVYRVDGLRVVTVNMDSPNEHDNIQSTLEAYGALEVTENYLSRYGNADVAFREFNIRADQLPFMRGFDRFGNQVGDDDELSLDIATQLDPLLDWKPATDASAENDEPRPERRKLDVLPLDDPAPSPNRLPRR